MKIIKQFKIGFLHCRLMLAAYRLKCARDRQPAGEIKIPGPVPALKSMPEKWWRDLPLEGVKDDDDYMR